MSEATFGGSHLDEKEVLLLHPETNEPFHIPLDPEDPRVHVSHVGTYPPKQVIGDWTRADHEVLSSWVQSEFVGGGQMEHADEAADQSRFWFGTLETRHPYQMALPLRTLKHEGEGTAIPLGDLNGQFYAAFGTTLCRVTATTVVEVAELEQVPMPKPALAFTGHTNQTRLYIPMGSHGYQIFDGATLSSLITEIAPIQFLEWDEKIYGLDADGVLWESLEGEGDWSEKLRVHRDNEVRGMIVFYDKQDNPTPHIISRRAVYGCDMSLGKAYRTELDPPPHHDAGLAAAKWRTDLYVSYGVGVHQYTGQSIIAMGLDRDYGLPRELRGAIVSMAEGYNGLYALVRGSTVPVGGEHVQGLITDAGWHDLYVPPGNARSAVMMWDGFGWSTVWLSDDTKNAPSSMVISTAPGFERLWWGYGNTLLYQDVHHMYYNPVQRPEEVEYAEEGWLTTATLDFSMAGTKKILHQIELMTRNVTSTETIAVEYRVDSGSWKPLGTVTVQPEDKRTIFRVGANGTFPDGQTPRFDGEPFNDLTLRFRFKRGADPSKTPLLESYAVIYHKLMGGLIAFQFSTPLGLPRFAEYKNHTAGEILAFFEECITAEKLVPFLYAGKWRNVRFAGASGDNRDGVLYSGNRIVSLLEVLE